MVATSLATSIAAGLAKALAAVGIGSASAGSASGIGGAMASMAGAALKGSAIGAVTGGTQSAISGEGFGKGALMGAATGAATGAAGNLIGNAISNVASNVGQGAASKVASGSVSEALKDATSNTSQGVLESAGGSTSGVTSSGTSTITNEAVGATTPAAEGAGAIGSGAQAPTGATTPQGGVLESGASTTAPTSAGGSEVQQMANLHVNNQTMPTSELRTGIENYVSNAPSTGASANAPSGSASARGKADVSRGLSNMATAASLIQMPFQAAQAKRAQDKQEEAQYKQGALQLMELTEKNKAKAEMQQNAFDRQNAAWAQTSLLKFGQQQATSLGLLEGSGEVRSQSSLLKDRNNRL